MSLLASHNALTGETPLNWVSSVFSIFSKCQSKTLQEQLESGVTAFDFRFRYDSKGILRAAHGLWMSEMTAISAIGKVAHYAMKNNKTIWLLICYEGKANYKVRKRFLKEINEYLSAIDNVELIQIAVKKPTWTIIQEGNCLFTFNQAHKVLDFRSYHTLIPIPIVWKEFQYIDKKFAYNWVDFI